MRLTEQEQIEVIKARMPQTYRSICDKAQVHGSRVWRAVRRGLRGEANQFYALEGGYVVGTPFDVRATAQAAALMVEFGCVSAVFWAQDLIEKEMA